MDRFTALQRHYDEVATSYEKVSQQIDQILARVKIPPGAAVLDAGCGTGNLTFRLPGIGRLRMVVGVDLSEKVLQVARKRARQRGLENFQFLQGDVCRLPFAEGEFQVVVSNMVLHLVPDLGNALAEIRRVLAPGGAAMLQFQGGGDVAAETVGFLRQAWSQVLPDQPPPALFNATTIETVGRHLEDLGVEDFQVTWRRITMRIPASKVDAWLKGFHLVSGFWRQFVDAETGEQIDRLFSQRVRQEAQRQGCFVNTGNILLVEFAKALAAPDARAGLT